MIIEQEEHENYRGIVFGRDGTELLLACNGERHLLPWVQIPPRQRVAENVTVAVRNEWGEEVVVLFELPSIDGSARYVAAEHLCKRCDSKTPTRWVPEFELGQSALIDADDVHAIERVIDICKGQIEGTTEGPFARLGWFRDLRNWITSVIAPMGLHLTGEFRQLNASPTFSLIRFATDGPAVWFKAVGEPNLREFTVTCALAQLFPDFLPPLLATRSDWHGWLSMELQGKLLSEVQEQALWQQASGALARLQIESIDRGSTVLAADAHELGLAQLSALIEPFMRVVAELMQCQKKVPPAILNDTDLQALKDSLLRAADAMKTARIPETLGHLDLNPGNIVVSENRCGFLDWAEAYFGNPLFSLEYLVQYARRTFGDDSGGRTAKMIAAYCAQWDRVVSTAVIAHALAFTPLLAVFAYAAGNDVWKQPDQLQDPATAGFLRSLARRMHREAQEVADRGSRCVS